MVFMLFMSFMRFLLSTGNLITLSRCRLVASMSIVVVLLSGCMDSQKKTAIDLTGSWQSEIDESIMSIEDSGLFAVEIPGERLAIIGTVEIEGSRATFRNRAETKLCVGDDGVYDIEIVDDRLLSKEVRDTCPSRVLHMSRPWRRLSADQSPRTNGG